MALEAGEIDMIIDSGGVLPDDISVIEEDPDLEVLAGTYCIDYYLTFNCGIPPFDDPVVRQAIQYAVDQESIVNDVLLGHGKVAESIVTSDVSTWFYPGSEAVYDPELAATTLESAGWTDTDSDGILDKDGEPFSIVFLVSSSSGQAQIAEVVQGQLSQVGIEIEIQIVDSGVYYSVIAETEGHHMLLLGYPFLGPNNVLYRSFHSTGDWNLRGCFYYSPEMDELLELGKKTTDQQARYDIYADVQKLVGEDNPIIPLYEGVLINAQRTSIEGYRLHPWFIVNWHDIYVSG
jgi:peptide/nickel transport system substrate-binding protein